MFQAKTPDGRVVKGYHCVVEGKHCIILDNAKTQPLSPGIAGWGIHGFVEILPSTLAQDTTVKDKHGKPIYGSFPIEGKMSTGGDDVRITDFAMIALPTKGKVIWSNLSWQIEDGGMLCIFDTDCLEVIGQEEKQ